jgi:hypothetical protein
MERGKRMGNFGEFKYVKTRKQQTCIYCGRKLPAGTNMRNYHGLWEGDWQNWYCCGFCEKNVEPEYTTPGEEIDGDEFSNWFHESNYVICPKCNNQKNRYHNDWDWTDLTHIKVECGDFDCGHEWIIEIPIDGEGLE